MAGRPRPSIAIGTITVPFVQSTPAWFEQYCLKRKKRISEPGLKTIGRNTEMSLPFLPWHQVAQPLAIYAPMNLVHTLLYGILYGS